MIKVSDPKYVCLGKGTVMYDEVSCDGALGSAERKINTFVFSVSHFSSDPFSFYFYHFLFSISSESLLHGFFLFYSEFDFENQAISIIEGSTFPKPADFSPLYLENPLCIGLNICKNVSSKNLEAFTDAMKVAARKVESLSETSAEAGSDNSLKVASPHGDGFQGSRLSFLFNSDIMDNQQNVNVEVLDLFEDDREFENAAKEALKDSEVKEGDKITSGAETTGLPHEKDSSLSEGGDTALHEKSW